MPAPSVVNSTCTNIDSNSANLGGDVAHDGGAAITARGVVYAETAANPNPTLGGAGVTNLTTSAAVGAFTIYVGGLKPNTSYSFAAYATNTAGTTYTNPVSTFQTIDGSSGVFWLLRQLASLPLLINFVIVAVLAMVAYYLYKNPAADNPEAFARGLITILFATGTVAVAFILTVSVIMSSDTEFAKRFDKGKEILTVMIGIFGTIMGFYFGTATNQPTEASKLTLTGPSTTLSVKQGEKLDVALKLRHDAKSIGNVSFSVAPVKGLTTEFAPESIKPSDGDDVTLKVTVDPNTEIGAHILRITASPEGGTPSRVDVKIKVLGK